MRAAIILAAGRSRRFVGGNKLLARGRGASLLAHAIRAALLAPVARVIAVVGHDAVRVARAARRPRVRIVVARGHRAGVSASLRAGLAALWPVERTLFVYLGDMPAVPPALPRRLARAMRPGTAAVRPRGAAGPGHPVLLRRPAPATLARLAGDCGLGGLIAGTTRWIDLPGQRSDDIDTRRDLARWRARGMR